MLKAATPISTHARCAALILAFSATAATSLAQPASAGFKVRDGVVADPARGALYIAAPEGGVQAVALSTGATLWENGDGAVPLAVAGTVLLAQGEEGAAGPRLPLVLMDVGAGGRTLWETTVELPAGVSAHVTDRRGRSFRVSAEPSGDGFLVSWSSVEIKNARGTAPDPNDRTLVRSLEGTARILAGGVVAPSTEPAAPRRTVPAGPFPAGAVIADVEGAKGEPLVLKRRNASTGAALPDRRLLDRAVVAMPAADARAVVGIERVGEGGPDDPEYLWSLFSLETGDTLGRFRRDVSATPFFISGETVFFESTPHGMRESSGRWVDEPLEVRAARLAGGQPVWERAVRDLEYRGTTPPMR